MRTKSISKSLKVGSVSSREFTIEPQMVASFVHLTSDESSLHTDSHFARRSMYRNTIVHGMLPLGYLSALKFTQAVNKHCSFQEIKARFLKPVFVNDRLVLNAVVRQFDDESRLLTFDYEISNVKSTAVVTQGQCVIKYLDQQDCLQVHDPAPTNSKMISQGILECTLLLDQICKDDRKSLSFVISEGVLKEYCLMLKDGLASDEVLDYMTWSRRCDAMNLIGSCVLSTFVGMYLPGRYATFIDMDMKFVKDLRKSMKYNLVGKVSFISRSTGMLAEDMRITLNGHSDDVVSSGMVKVKVNDPPTVMPSIKEIKKVNPGVSMKGKTVLITGASRGVGETAAKLFSLQGANVVINYYRGRAEARALVREIKLNKGNAIDIQADVADRQQVKAMIERAVKYFGTVDVLVNNAVRDFLPIPFLELTWEDMQKDIDVTIKGAFNCCQEVVPYMIQQNGGKIVNVCTVATETPPSHQGKYVVSKSGLLGLSRSLAVEFAAQNIQVNAVMPSMLETDLSKHVPKVILNRIRQETPMQRNAHPLDVAKAILFLSSELAAFTTGQKVMVTGGNVPFL